VTEIRSVDIEHTGCVVMSTGMHLVDTKPASYVAMLSPELHPVDTKSESDNNEEDEDGDIKLPAADDDDVDNDNEDDDDDDDDDDEYVPAGRTYSDLQLTKLTDLPPRPGVLLPLLITVSIFQLEKLTFSKY